MTADAIQEAATQIAVAYLKNHPLPADKLPSLLASIMGALSSPAEIVRPDVRERSIYRTVSRQDVPSFVEPDVEIEDEDQLEPLAETEEAAWAALQEHSAEPTPEPDLESEVEEEGSEPQPESHAPTKGRSRSYRSKAAAQAETSNEDGITVTRLPEVRRSRKR